MCAPAGARAHGEQNWQRLKPTLMFSCLKVPTETKRGRDLREELRGAQGVGCLVSRAIGSLGEEQAGAVGAAVSVPPPEDGGGRCQRLPEAQQWRAEGKVDGGPQRTLRTRDAVE